MLRSLTARAGLPLALWMLSASLLAQEPAPAALPDAPWLEGEANAQHGDVFALDPKIHGDELRRAARAALERGFAFLVGCQNLDGTWGSHDPPAAFLKDFGFQTASRGAQDGVRLACTAIVAKALLRKSPRSEAEDGALQRAVQALLGTEKFAYELGECFNTWGYGYKLDFLCDYLETPGGTAHREAVRAAAQVCIDGLRKFQQADGGWNYYAGPMGDGESMSFNTANFAEALERARKLGLDVPPAMVRDAYRLLRRFLTARGGVVYDARFLLAPGSVHELSAAARTAAVTEALAEAGRIDAARLHLSRRIFDEGENYLEDGRKLIVPHTAVHQVSGYFFFYGYHYLAEFLARLGDDVPRHRWERNAWTMIRTQEKDGSWWDTAAADYGDKWGTGFALLVLQRSLDAIPATQPAVR